MADELRSQVERISVKFRMLLDRYEHLRAERDSLQERLTQAEAGLLVLRAENEKLQQLAQYLKMASQLAPDPVARDKARKLITGLIADIDRCIADLRD